MIFSLQVWSFEPKSGPYETILFNHIYCKRLSPLGVPTEESFSIYFDNINSQAVWHKKNKVYESYTGHIITASTDSIAKKIKAIAEKNILGFKFSPPKNNQNSFLRIIILNDEKKWLTGFLILTTKPNADDSDETVITNDELSCSFTN